MTKALVTGGEGFLGARVVAELQARGLDVVWTSQGETSAGGSVSVDLREPGALRQHLSGVDVVAHLAARAGGRRFQEMNDPSVFWDNRSMTDNVLRDAAAGGVRRVFLASSTVVYAPGPARPHLESDRLLGSEDRPSPYAWSKITDELVARWTAHFESGLETVVGRFTNIFGPGGPADEETGTVVHSLLRKALAAADDGADGFEVWGDPGIVRSFIFVTDAARAVATLLLEEGAGGVYNVDTGIPTTIGQLAGEIARQVDPKLEPKTVSTGSEGVPYRVTDPERLFALGFSAEISLADGIGRCVAHARR